MSAAGGVATGLAAGRCAKPERCRVDGPLQALRRRKPGEDRSAVPSFGQAALEAELTEALGPLRKARASRARLFYRSGCYPRSLITRGGTLELVVPQDRAGLLSTELFERYQRSEKALVGSLAKMDVQGTSTRKAVTEAAMASRPSSILAINKTLDESLRAFSERRLNEAYPYLIFGPHLERDEEKWKPVFRPHPALNSCNRSRS